MITAVVTSRGQIVIPAKIRKKLKIKKGAPGSSLNRLTQNILKKFPGFCQPKVSYPGCCWRNVKRIEKKRLDKEVVSPLISTF